jgi:SAM-dependent methyltransferase
VEPYTYSIMRSIEDGHWWFVARRQIIAALLRSLNLPNQARILEVGSGTGGNLAMLSEFGTVIGVESDPSAADMANERGLAPVFQGSLPLALPEFDEHFDLICLLDVIEHIEDDAASLRALAALLKSGGRIVLTVPAFNFLWSQHDDENRHQRRYRRPGVSKLVATAELNLDYASYFNTWLFPPVALMRIFRKLVPYKESWKDMRQPGETLNRMLGFIFSSERHLVGKIRLPFGISLVAVMSK